MPNPYAPGAGRIVSRLLSLMDRDPTSPTYGCLDRPFWHYKTLVEFPAGTWQESALALAIACRTPFEGNPLAASPIGPTWASAALRYWTRCQNRDGSVDEWFHREHSFCATSFTAFAAAEALELLGDAIEGGARTEVADGLARAAAWLARHDNPAVANQRCGSAGALLAIGRLTGQARLEAAGRDRLARVLESFDEEGWLPEYGGADLGYLSVSLSALARLARTYGDERLEAAMARAARFTRILLAPDGSSGGATGSRQTQFLMPLGFELLAARGNEDAVRVLELRRAAARRGRVLGPDEVDDRYLAFFFASNHLGALAAWRERASPPASPAPDAPVEWPRAGFVHRVAAGLSTLVARRNQGAVTIHTTGEAPRRALAHFGYRARWADGAWASTAGPATEPAGEVLREPGGSVEIRLEAPFLLTDRGRPLERLVVPFKVYTSTLARSDAIAQRFGRWLKERKILARRERPLRLVRRIRVGPDGVRIEDELVVLGRPAPVEVHAEGLASPIHVPSTRFYRSDDLEGRPVLPDASRIVRSLDETGRAVLVWTVRPGDGEVVAEAL